MPRPGGNRQEINFVSFVRLLHAGCPEIIHNHLCKIRLIPRSLAVRLLGMDQIIVFINCQNPVRGNAFHRKRSGHPDFFVVLIGFVVKVFGIRLGCNGGINFLLPGNAVFPPFRMKLHGFLRPFAVGIAGNFPFFPFLFEGVVDLAAKQFKRLLIFFPDDIDFGIVGNGFQGDMRDAFIDETLADIAVG